VYYSAQILFLGVEVTKVYAHKHGSRFLDAAENAESVTNDQRANQGLKPKDTPPVPQGKPISVSGTSVTLLRAATNPPILITKMPL
jgi:hypothetical protein